MKDRLLGIFDKFYGGIKDSESTKNDGDIKVYFAPGRVNLIGEHTDYNGGHVFPCALTIGTYAAVRLREDDRIRLYSDNFPDEGIGEIKAGSFKKLENPDWCNYPIGVMWTLKKHGYDVNRGMDIAFYGDIPDGSGLSSSASIEVLTAYMMNDLFGFGIELKDIAVLCQYSENKFNDSNCGIMDQFAIAMGKAGHAIFLDTATLKYEYAPIKLENAKIVISCSNKKRGLGDSKYNERRSECETALAELQKVVKIDSLGELTEEQFEQYKDAIKDPVRVKRAKHAVYENQRTIKAVDALKKNDVALFGQLMNASHVSLRDDYEVTGIELDTLVEEAWKVEGVIGSRMTGAGFGGCTVSIVKDEAVDAFIEKVGTAYKDKIGYAADFYVVEIGDGPVKLA